MGCIKTYSGKFIQSNIYRHTFIMNKRMIDKILSER